MAAADTRGEADTTYDGRPWATCAIAAPLQRIGKPRDLSHLPIRGAMVLIGVALLLMTAGCVYTGAFTDAHRRVIPGSVATMEIVTVGGIPQSIWFRGVSRSNPPLILLHGGPGASESALFRYYNAALEQHFLVVYWEQRGAGRSFHSDIPPESMTIDHFVRDLDEVVELVGRRFGKGKVVLLGHSWGTVLGTIYASRHPKKVLAYVGVAQIADMPHGDQLSFEFALSEARRRGNSKAISELESIGPPPYASVDERLAVGKWVERFGGAFHAHLSTGKLIWAALSTDEANLIDLVKFGQGNRFALTRLGEELSQLSLSEHYRSFDVPIFFLLGRYDRHVPAVLAEQYFEAIRAPCKRLVWFEGSAHHPPFEEPEKFNRLLIEEVLPSVDERRIQSSGSTYPDETLQPAGYADNACSHDVETETEGQRLRRLAFLDSRHDIRWSFGSP